MHKPYPLPGVLCHQGPQGMYILSHDPVCLVTKGSLCIGPIPWPGLPRYQVFSVYRPFPLPGVPLYQVFTVYKPYPTARCTPSPRVCCVYVLSLDPVCPIIKDSLCIRAVLQPGVPHHQGFVVNASYLSARCAPSPKVCCVYMLSLVPVCPVTKGLL